MEVNEQADAFWRFVCERQAIWFRKEELHLQPPWTDDPVLGSFHFTNIYRDLDKGTKWLRRLMEDRRVETLADAVWYAVSYRLINRIGTFEETSGPPVPDPEELLWWHGRLRAHRGDGNAVFTSRHQCKTLAAYEDVTKELLAEDGRGGRLIDSLAHDIQEAGTGDGAVEVLRGVRWVGEFFAHQVYLDLDDSGMMGFTDDEFIPLGPGSRMGMKILSPDLKPTLYRQAISELQANQHTEIQRLGLEFHPYNGMTLRPRDIEHALCEFQKYCMIVERKGVRTGSKVMASASQKWWADTAEELQ